MSDTIRVEMDMPRPPEGCADRIRAESEVV